MERKLQSQLKELLDSCSLLLASRPWHALLPSTLSPSPEPLFVLLFTPHSRNLLLLFHPPDLLSAWGSLWGPAPACLLFAPISFSYHSITTLPSGARCASRSTFPSSQLGSVTAGLTSLPSVKMPHRKHFTDDDGRWCWCPRLQRWLYVLLSLWLLRSQRPPFQLPMLTTLPLLPNPGPLPPLSPSASLFLTQKYQPLFWNPSRLIPNPAMHFSLSVLYFRGLHVCLCVVGEQVLSISHWPVLTENTDKGVIDLSCSVQATGHMPLSNVKFIKMKYMSNLVPQSR